MIWTEFDSATASTSWYQRLVSSNPPPSSWRLEDPRDTYSAVLADPATGLVVTAWPGGIEMAADRDVSEEYALAQIRLAAFRALESVDSRRIYQWADLNAEEEPPSYAAEQYSAEIADTPVIGPGGRLVIYRHGAVRSATLAIRRPTDELPARWRDTADVSARLRVIFDEPADDVRVRGAFGYHELSLYEEQEVVHPAVVIVVDRPSPRTGPRWRVVHVERATSESGGASGTGRLADRCQ